MSHLKTLANRLIRAVDRLECNRSDKKEMMSRVTDIIEYIYYFHKQIPKEEVVELTKEIKFEYD